MHPEFGFQIAPNWPQIGKMTMTPQLADIALSSNLFDTFLFFLSNFWFSFILISSLVLEL